ncbi:uncharacterized protein BP5553_09029 [Venustampulla echinocandica]|uniref:Acyltransferase 3 domain-containing protein n=1 Tax=Venustampulla echinocandica TaxID=2656787 RepID=A0A370TDM9_9HELO|nr:uncharacterized protein BP5553_09029 [Venustampulla echinocandica]RDL32573.1 hypothetical protein BP5553_09029 [Venustampulla echinocandica]
MSARQENVKWVDGLRGIGSLLVVTTHIARAFDEDLFKPTSEENASPRIFQYPILRIIIQGRIGVAIFSLVTGYVCALKPIRQCHAGTPEAALVSIAKSASRRVPRLILPTTLATTIIWLLCQFGVFQVANRTDRWWLRDTSPNMIPYFGNALHSLVMDTITTWTRSWNAYDVNQWTLQPLLKGSMMVYMMIAATVFVKPKYRMMIAIALYFYYYISTDSAFGMQFFFGVFLSDISQNPTHIAWCQARKWPARVLAPVLISIGLILASYPEEKAEWMHWSLALKNLGAYIFPVNGEVPRFYTGLGLEFIALGIHFSSIMKNVLSNKYLLWFGKNSFAVYLIHGTLLRTLLVWMFFGTSLPPNVTREDGSVVGGPPLTICGSVRFFTLLPIWFVILYTTAHYWTKYVDPWCARITERGMRYIYEDHQESGSVESKRPALPK